MPVLAGIFDPLHNLISPLAWEDVFRMAGPSDRREARAPGPLLAAFGRSSSNSGPAEDEWLWSSRGDAIALDGRVDNRGELIARLHVKGSPPTDAAIALLLYQAAGKVGLKDLIGDWSLAIWDAANRQVVLASDFAGTRPLYYCARAGQPLVWSSSLRHIVEWTGSHQLDPDYVIQFLDRGGAGAATPYRDIVAVPSAHTVAVGSKGIELREFWRLEPGRKLVYASADEYVDHCRMLFDEGVRVRLRSTGPVFAELSGGMDSSSVVSVASTLIAGRDVPCPRLIAVNYFHPGSTDEPFHRAMQAYCGVESFRFDTEQYPFVSADSAGGMLPQWWTSRDREMARTLDRAGSNVLMTGRTGDLVFGNWHDDSDQVADLLRRGAVREAVEQSLEWSNVLRIPFYSVFWRALVTSFGLEPASHRTEAAAGGDGPMDDLVRSDFRKRICVDAAFRARSAQWRFASPGRRKVFQALHCTLSDRVLQVPEALQHFSYTHPCMHRPLAEFMLSIPPAIVCGPGQPRRLMRRALGNALPRQVLTRRSKASFDSVFHRALRPLALQLLGKSSESILCALGYVDRPSLVVALTKFLDGLACNEAQLRQAILLEFWLSNRTNRSERAVSNDDSRPLCALAPQ